ncbi:MAG: phenylacetate--CoA ligase family protein [Anaerolineae bacterium]|nr:phenylacetate--CoA ligase family protein [Anaerolineae bacterium]
MISKRRVVLAAWDIWRAKRGGSDAIQARQQMRLQAMIAFARSHSPFYQTLYQHLPKQIDRLTDLPPVTKHDLMAHFDEWATDPEIREDSVRAFIADPALIGVPYLGRYGVWQTSGTTGLPGVFVHDANAIATYYALVEMRGILSWMTVPELWQLMRRHWRTAFVFATGGHFGSNTFDALTRQLRPGSSEIPILSVHMPLADLVHALNDSQLAILETYPSVLAILTNEQASGRLKIKPLLIVTVGECLKPLVREQAASVFRCGVHDLYGASEFVSIAFDCKHGRLHVNSDWVILEPVDADYRPVAPGSPSHTILLTNLVNRVQPLIRYEMGDSVAFHADSCPCGNPLPTITVEGRDDEILTFETPTNRRVDILPSSLATIVMLIPGVQRFQLVQTNATTLSVRLEAAANADEAQVWQSVVQRLEDYLASQGLTTIQIERSADAPHKHATSGKFRHVWSEWRAGQLHKETHA